MGTMKDTSQTRRAYETPAVVYETELEVHAESTSGTTPPTSTGGPFGSLDLDK